jgi:hypothetical protein
VVAGVGVGEGVGEGAGAVATSEPEEPDPHAAIRAAEHVNAAASFFLLATTHPHFCLVSVGYRDLPNSGLTPLVNE